MADGVLRCWETELVHGTGAWQECGVELPCAYHGTKAADHPSQLRRDRDEMADKLEAALGRCRGCWMWTDGDCSSCEAARALLTRIRGSK